MRRPDFSAFGRHDRRGERGAAAVEFAIVVVVLLLIVFGIIDFGRLFFVQQSALSASRETARYAVVAKNATEISGAKAKGESAAAAAASLGASGATPIATITSGTPPVNVTGVCTSGSSVTATVAIRFKWLTLGAFIPGLNNLYEPGGIKGTTVMRCER